MFQKQGLLAVLALSLVSPSPLIAGGPPWLCLPIAGVTPDDAEACTTLIEAKLQDKLWSHLKARGGAKIHHDGNQPYLTCYMKQDISLGDIETALRGSEFSIPRDKIRMFGHVVLDVDTKKSTSKEIVTALDAMEYVGIVETEDYKGRLLITVELPYPVVDNRPNPEDLRWDKFARNDYSSVDFAKSASPIGPGDLPGFYHFREVLTKQGASLQDIRWSNNFACRALGCVIAPKTEPVLATATDVAPAKKN
jgi:hypothetical protein